MQKQEDGLQKTRARSEQEHSRELTNLGTQRQRVSEVEPPLGHVFIASPASYSSPLVF